MNPEPPGASRASTDGAPATAPPNGRVRISADVGGTFTDVVLVDGRGSVWTHKVPSTPPDFERAVLEATRHLLERSGTAASEVARWRTERPWRPTPCSSAAAPAPPW